MVLTLIRLKNFCGFQDYKIDIDPLTILVGPNNGGKTTVLRAIQLIEACLGSTVNGIGPRATELGKKLNSLERTFTQNVKARQQNIENYRSAGIHNASEIITKLQSEIDGLTKDYERNKANAQEEILKKRHSLDAVSKRLLPQKRESLFYKNDSDKPASVTLEFSNTDSAKISIAVSFHLGDTFDFQIQRDGTDILLASEEVRWDTLKNITAFSSAFLPPLPVVAKQEQIKSWPEVERAIQEGNFYDVWRNQVHWLSDGKAPEEFQRVADGISRLLPGISLLTPSRSRDSNPVVNISYVEEGERRDISEAGAGTRSLIALSCTLLLGEESLLLLDEPDAHLHLSVQRALASLLSDQSLVARQIIVASHSPDIIETVPIEALRWIDRHESEARKCNDVGLALADLGAISHKTALLISEKPAILYFEGTPDKNVLRKLLERAGLSSLEEKCHFDILDGCGDSKHLAIFARFLHHHQGKEVRLGCILDADYSTMDAEYAEVNGILTCKLPCTELENLLLLDTKAIFEAANESARRRLEYIKGGQKIPTLDEINNAIDEVTKTDEVESAARRNHMARILRSSVSAIDKVDGDSMKRAEDQFTAMWNDPMQRRRYCDGKRVLALTKVWFQRNYGITIGSAERIFGFYTVPPDLQKLFAAIEAFYSK